MSYSEADPETPWADDAEPSTSGEPRRRVHLGIVALQAIAVLGLAAWGITAFIGSTAPRIAATGYAAVTASDTRLLTGGQGTAGSGSAAGAGPVQVGAVQAGAGDTPAVQAGPVQTGAVQAGPVSQPASAAESAADSASESALSAQTVRPLANRVAADWLDRISARIAVPRRALAAYAGAALALTDEKPGCHLGWNTLAAIAHIESDDGRHGGSVLSDNGYPSLPIIGPALDGSAFAGIHDSDGGKWDGDSVWDHAVGPFQFIPQTWRSWGADGNGDGQADPNQIDDAALAAGRYLCHAGDLSTVDGWRRAVFSYNHSDSYVDTIAGLANRYLTSTKAN